MTFWRKLNYLIPEPNCRTDGEKILEWFDVRVQPSQSAIDSVDMNDVIASEQDAEAENLRDARLAFVALMEILYENNVLATSFPQVRDFKLAVKERYKSKI